MNASAFTNPNYTYSAWVKSSSNPSYDAIYMIISMGGKGADQNLALANYYSTSHTTGWAVSSYIGPSNVIGYDTKSLPAVNIWVHLVVTRSNTDLKLYINGQFAGSTSSSGQSPIYNTPLKAVIGTRSHYLSQFFHGLIDDVAIYNRALSPTEVTALYQGSACQAPVPQPIVSNQSRCGAGTVTLTASGGTQYHWYDSLTGGNLLGSSASFTTPVLSATTKYYVANVVDNRESIRKEVTATIFPIPHTPVVADTFRCGPGTIDLIATGASNYHWYTSEGNYLATGLTFTTPTLTKTTTFCVVSYENGCEGERKSIKVTVLPSIPAPLVMVAGSAQICEGDSVVLSATPGCIGYRWSTGDTTQSIVVKESGNYTVKTINYSCISCGKYTCESLPSKPVKVTVKPLAAAPEIKQVCLDSLQAISDGQVFSWYRDGVPLPFTSRSIPAEQSGMYIVRVRDINNCLSAPSVQFDFTVQAEGLSVYPNPSQGIFTVKVNDAKNVIKLEMMNMRNGRVLWKTDLANGDCRLNATINLQLHKGVYLIRLHTSKGVYHERLYIL